MAIPEREISGSIKRTPYHPVYVRKGNCYDNCIIETFFGRMKTEMYYGCENKYSSFKEFSQAVDEYIHYYNNERIQKKTNWMSPVKYRETSTGNG